MTKLNEIGLKYKKRLEELDNKILEELSQVGAEEDKLTVSLMKLLKEKRNVNEVLNDLATIYSEFYATPPKEDSSPKPPFPLKT